MKANVKWQQGVLRPSTPIRRKESLTSTSWFTFLHWMLGLGGIALMAWIFFGGFKLGEHSSATPIPVKIEVPGLEKTATALEAVAGKLKETPTTPSASGEVEEAGVKPIPKPKSLWELNP
ncbi:MAG TPA: hypothetical protein VI978_00465 [Candidatus Paceibacterota bacterium]